MSAQSQNNQSKKPVIALEGIDGCGKGTQVDLLLRAVSESTSYLTVSSSVIPRLPHPCGHIRNFILSGEARSPVGETLAYAAAVYETMSMLRSSDADICIADRSFISTECFQMTARESREAREMYKAILSSADYREMVMPDLIVVLDIDQETRKSRTSKRGGMDHIEKMSDSFHQKVRDAYLYRVSNWRNMGYCPIVSVDGVGAVHEVHARVLSAIKENSPRFKNPLPELKDL